MTNYEKLRELNLEDFGHWLWEVGHRADIPPWWAWFENEHCSHCPKETTIHPFLNKKMLVDYCELQGKCRFYRDLSDEEVIKAWLMLDNKSLDDLYKIEYGEV